MLKDRIVDVGSKRILLPKWCSSPSGAFSVNELKAILESDRHSVLITGETGTGKEMLADYAEHKTKLDKKKCQRINCAGLDSNLVGSELFGHKRGAFTDAKDDRPGLLKSCHGGILFLDEIGWLPDDLQARLLRFMETGEIRPLGSDKIDAEVSVRILAATNKNPYDVGVMIPDLRQRFDFEVKLPPLRDRAEDILWLICEPGFLGEEKVFKDITLRTLAGMLTSPWEGNIRELKNYCQRKILFRHVEEPNEVAEHILDDCSLGDEDTLHRWSLFAGSALAEIEDAIAEGFSMSNDSTHRTYALLNGLFCGMGARYSRSGLSRDFVAKITMKMLKKSVAGEIPGMKEFDLVHDTIKSALYNFWNVDYHLDYKQYAGELDLSRAFAGLSYFVKELAKGESGCFVKELAKRHPNYFSEQLAKSHDQDIRGISQSKIDLSSAPIYGIPSDQFIRYIGFAGPDGLFASGPERLSDYEEFEKLLDSEHVENPEREFALLCWKGLSNSEISNQTKCTKNKVQESLSKLRENSVLEPFLPIKKAGRPLKTHK